MSRNFSSRGFWINQTIVEGQRADRQATLANHFLNNNLHTKNDPKLIQEIKNLQERNQILENDNEYYSRLLAKPMAEIAAENHQFKETYEQQMELLADWMVSQKAFKELAIQFGIEKGLTSDEVVEMGKNKKMDVLENKHEEQHNTNVSDSLFLVDRKDVLIERVKKSNTPKK